MRSSLYQNEKMITSDVETIVDSVEKQRSQYAQNLSDYRFYPHAKKRDEINDSLVHYDDAFWLATSALQLNKRISAAEKIEVVAQTAELHAISNTGLLFSLTGAPCFSAEQLKADNSELNQALEEFKQQDTSGRDRKSTRLNYSH